MHPAPDVACRTCGETRCTALGILPDWHEFAGVPVAPPFSGDRLYRCPACHLVFRAPILSEAEYAALYERAPAGRWDAKAWSMRNDQQLVRRWILEHYPAGGSVLDIGCATGEFVASLPAAYRKAGIETSLDAVRVCQARGVRIIGDDLRQATASGERFDVIVAIDVIEHVPHPERFIGDAFRLLEPGGRLLLTTGDADDPLWREQEAGFWYCAYAGHISFLSRAWLEWLARRDGYRLESFRKFRHTDRQAWKRAIIATLSSAMRLTGRMPDPTWRGHASEDHLFAVLSG